MPSSLFATKSIRAAAALPGFVAGRLQPGPRPWKPEPEPALVTGSPPCITGCTTVPRGSSNLTRSPHAAALWGAEQPPRLAGDLQVFAGGDHQGPHGRRGGGDVTVIAGMIVAVDVDGDAEVSQPLGRPAPDHG
jgi:hypothetical protein